MHVKLFKILKSDGLKLNYKDIAMTQAFVFFCKSFLGTDNRNNLLILKAITLITLEILSI
jgi:hypothetical protein